MRSIFSSKVFVNKKNGQVSLTIPKKQIKFNIDRFPKELKLKIKEIKW